MADYYFGDFPLESSVISDHTHNTLIEVESTVTESARLSNLGLANTFFGAQDAKDVFGSGNPGPTGTDDVVYWRSTSNIQPRMQSNASNVWAKRFSTGNQRLFTRVWYTSTSASTNTFDIEVIVTNYIDSISITNTGLASDRINITATGVATAGELKFVDAPSSEAFASTGAWDEFGGFGVRLRTNSTDHGFDILYLGHEFFWTSSDDGIPT